MMRPHTWRQRISGGGAAAEPAAEGIEALLAEKDDATTEVVTTNADGRTEDEPANAVRA